MLVNMSAMKNRQMSLSTNKANGTFAPINGITAAFKGIFAYNFIFDSPASVSAP
jgi:hypothetical protein